jgi:3-hydroxymyristoyl/3-hydroxydecanoyl-(acyl carrier protein) dehydratase
MSVASQHPVADAVQLRSEQTLLRSLVHKRTPENVLLTGISTRGNDRFVCTGRLPSDHRFFNDAGRTPRKDILFYTELGRQASLAVSHAFLDVSTEDVFIFEGSDATVAEAAWSRAGQPGADCVVMDITIQEITRRRNQAVNRVVAQHRMSIAGEVVFHGTGAWTVQPAALFQRLRRTVPRGSSPAASIDTAWRQPASNVVVTVPTAGDDRTSFTSSLIVDYTHPYFFDHPCDHIPGMLLLEGCAQLALAAFAETTSVPRGRTAICSYAVNFAQFVECGLPTTLTAQVNADDDVEIVICQPDVVCGTTTMRVAFPV